jgi:hypothetical protein
VESIAESFCILNDFQLSETDEGIEILDFLFETHISMTSNMFFMASSMVLPQE